MGSASREKQSRRPMRECTKILQRQGCFRSIGSNSQGFGISVFSDCPTVLPSNRPTICPSDCATVCLSLRPSVRPSVCLSVRPTVQNPLSVRPSDRPAVCPTVRPSVHATFQPSVRPTVQPSVRSGGWWPRNWGGLGWQSRPAQNITYQII